MLMVLQFELCRGQYYNNMMMGDGSSLYVAGKNTLYHFNTTDLEEIANMTIGPYNYSDVTISLMKFVSGTSKRSAMLLFCSSLDYTCYNVSAHHINDVKEIGTKIRSMGANALYTEDSNETNWYIACPHQSTYLEEVDVFCSKPGIFRYSDFTDGFFTRFGVQFKLTGMEESVQTKEYVAGFALNKSRIFFSIQGFSVQSSHLTHVCQRQKKETEMIETYIDMPVLCGSNSILTDVKEMSNFYIASFTNQQRNGSAVCIYNQSTIKERFADNMRKCYKSEYDYSVNTSWYYIPQRERCDLQNNDENLAYLLGRTIHEVLCDGLPSYSGVIGDLPLTASSVLHYADQVIKAVTLTERDDIVIAFFGSDQLLNKAVIYPRNNTAKKLHTTYSVGGRSGLQKELLNDGTSVYALTSSTILKFLISNCATKSACHECLADQDPDCGWCILSNMCTTSSECKNSHIWLHASQTPTDSCPMISEIEPNVINVKTSLLNITVHISRDVDFTNTSLYCSFRRPDNSQGVSLFPKITRATLNAAERDQISCDHPFQDVRNTMDPSRGTTEMDVSLFLNTSNNPLMTSKITYFKCDNFRRCMDCVNTKWSCDWCPYASRCIDRGTGCNFSPNKTITRGDGCPASVNFTFNDDLSGDNGTLIISKAEYGVTIEGYNFLEEVTGTTYSCEARFLEPVTFTAIYLNTTTVRCLVNLTSLSTETGTFSTELVLKFGQFYVDGNHQSVLFYDCEKMITPRNNCGECKSFKYYKPHFRCHWCYGRCLYKTGPCQSSEPTQCPPPTILTVWPTSAFVNSTTLIDIQGYNFGSHFNETLNSVTIAGLPCVSQEKGYIPSKGISCLVGPSIKARIGSVDISLPGVVTSPFLTKEFSFKIPQVLSICPKLGPKSGGTRLYVKGIDLNIGCSQKIFVAGQLCKATTCTNATCYQNRSETTLCCHTGPANLSMVNNLHSVDLELDGQSFVVEEVNYMYVPDPVILSISPRKSFKNGGRNLTVTGINLWSVQEPKIYLKTKNNNRVSESFPCSRPEISNHLDEQKIFCPSPKPGIRKYRRRHTREEKRWHGPLYTILAFEMDGVKEVANLSSDIADITYYPNPIFTPFEEVQAYQKILIIEGSYLNVAATREDVTVWIGSKMKCNVSVFEHDKIYCNPPYRAISQTFPIKVQIGYFKTDVGFIKYVTDKDTSNTAIIIGVVVGVLVLLFATVTFVVFRLRKKFKILNREKKSLEYMMEKMEAKFGEQCRKGLQPAMSDLTGDLSGGNVLFRDYSVYAMFVLFTFERDHPVMKPPQVTTYFSVQAMDSLKNLLWNTQFLLVLIRTLDKEKSFTVQDKSNVASILMALNDDNMNFITEIMKTLLKDLVDRNVAAGSEKLLLRRSECVAEKLLTHWLSICLYHYLKENSGSKLFILYKAIKIQAERGPIDYISNCAKFTLSEDKLLAEDINPKPLELEVTHTDCLDNKEKTITVTVLECDTITQAKSKMLEIFYKNVGYSQRPSVHSTHIEWQQEDISTCVLSDEDPGSIIDGIWKKINTLEYYGVPDGSKMLLVHSRQDQIDNLLPDIESQQEDTSTCDLSDEETGSIIDGIWKRINTLEYYGVPDGSKMLLVHSRQDQIDNLLPDIESQQEDTSPCVLSDEDPGSIIDGIWKRINTLEYYGVPDGSKMLLVHSRQDRIDNLLPGIESQQEDTSPCVLSDEDPGSITDGIWKRTNTLEYYGVPDGSKMLLVYSRQDRIDNLLPGIELQQEDTSPCVLSDEDPGSITDGIWEKINTLEYYGVPDGSKMLLVHSRQDQIDNLLPGIGNPDSCIGSIKRTKADVRTVSRSNFWHLTKQHQGDSDEIKIASDTLLPRLLATKGTLQSYVDDLIGEILCVTGDPPIIIKYLFDFLDTAAEEHKITDPEVLHTWKCNSLLLRFWVNILKNPEFVFDIHKPQNVDKCLSVVAQVFMDSCSTADVNLGTGSPSNKLLFAKDIPKYKKLVRDYFQHVKEKPVVSDQDLNSFLTEKVSTKFSGNLNQTSALMEMYRYASKYRDAILGELDNLEAGSPGQYSPLASKLQRVYIMMDKEGSKVD